MTAKQIRQRATFLMAIAATIACVSFVYAVFLFSVGYQIAALVWIGLGWINIFLYWVNMHIYRRARIWRIKPSQTQQ